MTRIMKIMTRIILILIGVISLALSGCGEKAAQTKRYPIKGEVKAVDASVKTATITHGPIGRLDGGDDDGVSRQARQRISEVARGRSH